MLEDSDFQGSELATQLMAIYLKGDLGGDYGKHLMSGFSHKSSPSTKVIKIKDRETGYWFKNLYHHMFGIPLN